MGRWGFIALLTGFVLAGAGSAAGQISPRSDAPVPSVLTRGGSIVLKVVDYDPAREQVLSAVFRQSGALLGSRTEVNFEGKKHGWLRFRLAADRWPLLLSSVRSSGKLYAESIRTGDATSQYEELGRRIVRLREHQERLAALLQSPRRMRGSDILYLQERLFRAGVDEGQLVQRRVDLERAGRTGTLVVELFEAEPRRAMDLGNWYAGAMLRARTALYRNMAHAVTAGAYALAFAPFWIPALVVATVLGRWLWRRGRRIAACVAAGVGLLAVRSAASAALVASAVLARWPARGNAPRPSEPGAG
jgi:uncharacterized protein DUF4349